MNNMIRGPQFLNLGRGERKRWHRLRLITAKKRSLEREQVIFFVGEGIEQVVEAQSGGDYKERMTVSDLILERMG